MEYKEIKTIGQGGFGIVKHVKDKSGNDLALKEFLINPSMANLEEQAIKRFVKEAKYQKQIEHPNVVPIFEVDTVSTPPYYTMPLAEASMQDDYVSKYLSEDNFWECFYDIMMGLEEIHSYQIYHRDLKPGNILRFDNSYAISDFGLMSITETNITTITTTGMAKGTDMYTAPEITQDLRLASIQSDIYSLGCILHDFVGVNSRIPCNEINESSKYGDLLLCATRKDPERRFRSVAAFREALSSILQEDVSVKTNIAEKVLESLKKEVDNFDEDDILCLNDFLYSTVNQYDKHAILRSVRIEHIDKIISYPRYAKNIAKLYCEYIRNNSFEWNTCDTLADRLQIFIENGDVEIQSEGIFALLYMGTSHNRWYVERKVANYLGADLNESLLKRLMMEMRAEDREFCKAISHLFKSINYSKKNLNPKICEIVTNVCKL